MAYTQQDLDNIESAIATGELEVQHADAKVRYRSIEELQQAAAMIRRRLQDVDGQPIARVGNRSFNVIGESGI